MNRSSIRQLVEKEGIAALVFPGSHSFVGHRNRAGDWNKQPGFLNWKNSSALDFRTGANSPVLLSFVVCGNRSACSNDSCAKFSAMDRQVSWRESHQKNF